MTGYSLVSSRLFHSWAERQTINEKKHTRFQATEKVSGGDVSEGDLVDSEVQVRRPGEGGVTGSQERTPRAFTASERRCGRS